ncbi:ABC transporter ATP-binding protein [Actinospica sp.]|jgi:ABC-2 type transport system ATP-binding protein|uniref:ABC transporter ATP-binding protein n=1 Tax=Actinospica sp. TaxID=1872142 RepID=UPI002C98D5D8|nr:ABC transporter ATP-binding protein [Actinospica sp.]HWG25882.1 ABC transporter ATP-binding protein [Actinospica sp.]
MDTAISVQAVTKRYGALVAVDDVTLDIPRGRTVALLGPNGAGKSTTVAMLMGLTEPDTGSVTVGDRPPRAAVAAGGIAAMLQDSGLMPGVTVAELIELGRRLYPAPLSTAEALELAGLTTLSRRRVDRLSGGQAQRVKFALVAVANPETMLLDEPTRALDVQGRREFWTAMRAYTASGRTVLFATHYLEEVEENADRVVVMARGRIVADGTPAELRTGAGSAIVRFRLPVDAARPVLPGTVTVDDGWVTVRTDDPDAAVRALASGPHRWQDLSVIPPSLDDSFLRLTTEEPR